MSEKPVQNGLVWNPLELAAKQPEMWHEFFRIASMSMGIYKLPAGGTDPQNPHTEDEAYYILSGKGQIRVDDDVFDASAGKLIFVAKGAEHKFINIEEDMTILVFFAPAEGSLAR